MTALARSGRPWRATARDVALCVQAHLGDGDEQDALRVIRWYLGGGTARSRAVRLGKLRVELLRTTEQLNTERLLNKCKLP